MWPSLAALEPELEPELVQMPRERLIRRVLPMLLVPQTPLLQDQRA